MRRICRAICIGLFALVVLVIGPSVLVNSHTRGRVFSSMEELPCRRVGLVLGCPPCTPSGRPNLYFRNRMAAAVRLYNEGKVDRLLLSGMRTEDWDELSCMRRVVIDAGVPAKDLLLDCGSERTMGSLLRCREVFHEASIIVVSQASHARRAVYSASQLGIDAVGYAADDFRGVVGTRLRIREAFSRIKAIAEILLAQVWFDGLRSTVNMDSKPCVLADDLPCCLEPPHGVPELLLPLLE